MEISKVVEEYIEKELGMKKTTETDPGLIEGFVIDGEKLQEAVQTIISYVEEWFKFEVCDLELDTDENLCMITIQGGRQCSDFGSSFTEWVGFNFM